MDDAPGLPRLAGLLADPARARMLWTLIDGSARPAGELAWAAGVSAQSASGHLAKLVAGGLLSAQAQGRHRYFRIASAEAASAIEGLASLAARHAPRGRLRPPIEPELVHARTCYGHLAGETAVRVLDGLLTNRWLAQEDRDYRVTPLGTRKLAALGIEVGALQGGRRVFARSCIDLTQRRPHLAGALGEALLALFVERGWIRRQRRSRAVRITPQGALNFGRIFGA